MVPFLTVLTCQLAFLITQLCWSYHVNTTVLQEPMAEKQFFKMSCQVVGNIQYYHLKTDGN